MCMPLPSMNKAVHSGSKTQRTRHQKSKTGESMALKCICVHREKYRVNDICKSNAENPFSGFVLKLLLGLC